MAVDFDKMFLSSYMGNWPVVPVVIACGCNETVKGQDMLNTPFLYYLPGHQIVHGRFSIQWLFNGVVQLHGRDFAW